MDDEGCSACDNTGLVTIETRRGLELDDRVVPCPACRADDFENDGGEEYGDRADRDPDFDVPSYRERLVIAFGQQWLDDVEAA